MIVANAQSFTLTVICPEPMRLVVSIVTSPVARTVSPSLASRRSVVMRAVSPPETVTLSLTCTFCVGTAMALITVSAPGVVVESLRTSSSRRVVPSVTNPTSVVADAAPVATL